MIAAAWGLCAARAESADLAPQTLEIGWYGHLVLGTWTTATAELDVAEPATYRLDVAATDPDGNLAAFRGDEVRLPTGKHRIAGRFQLGRPDGQVRCTLYRDGAFWKELPPVSAQADLKPHRDSERLLITVGLPLELQSVFPPPQTGQRTILHFNDPSSLPADVSSYDGVSALLLAGKFGPDAVQSAAIEQWVRRGGRLLISLGSSPKEFRETPLAQRLPLEVDADLVPTRELTALETYAGKSVRIVPPGQRVMIPKLSYRFGRSLAGNRSDPVLVQIPWSFGTVTFLSMDVTEAPLREWKQGVGDLLRKMTDVSASAQQSAGRGQQLGSTGITDMASQVASALEDFEGVSRTSPWWVIGGLILVLALVGPIDYWLVDRIWKRPLATWVSFPVILAGCAGFAVWAASRSNGDQARVNQLAVIDLDAETDFLRARHWTTLYSPESRTYQFACQPAWTTWSPKNSENAILAASWAGLPETSFGGMYRSGATGLQFGQIAYSVSPAEGKFTDIPAAQWSTVALSAESFGTQSHLAESKLTSSATGRLSGTVIHSLPGRLTNWFVAYENRIFRQLQNDDSDAVVPLPAGQVFRVDQRSVMQRELRGHLTRTLARQVDQGNSSSGAGQIVLEQASYDPQSRNLAAILPLWSFHAKVDGAVYTGLRNDALAHLDMSPLLDLDRAVLIGFLEETAPEMTLTPAAAAYQGRRTTLVRLVLPVDRSKQVIRDLPKLMDKK